MRKKIRLTIMIAIFIISLVIINMLLKDRIKNQPNNEINNGINEEENEMGILNKNDENIIDVTSDNFDDEVLSSEKPVLIDFYANWCGPCMLLSPKVEQIVQGRDDIKLAKVNVDDEQELSINYGVISIPTLVLIKNGQEVDRIVGLVDEEEIIELIEK